jgi:hypothetical protein
MPLTMRIQVVKEILRLDGISIFVLNDEGLGFVACRNRSHGINS